MCVSVKMLLCLQAVRAFVSLIFIRIEVRISLTIKRTNILHFLVLKPTVIALPLPLSYYHDALEWKFQVHYIYRFTEFANL